MRIPPVERRSPEEVLGLGWSAPSARGSTYWRRVQYCPREHFLANSLNIAQARRSDPLDVGLVWHYALEAYYTALQKHQRGEKLEKNPDVLAFEVLQPFFNEQGWGEWAEKLSKMLDSYLDKYHHTDAKYFEILGVEDTLEVGVDVGYGFEYSSRFDLWVNDHEHGRPVLRHIEHKSASRLDHNTISGYTMDQQVLGQIWLGDTCIDPEKHAAYVGAYVNITTKPSAQKGPNAIPQHYRLPVAVSPMQLKSWENSMRFWMKQREIQEQWDFPRNYGACVRRYGRCQFFNLCQGDPEDGLHNLVQLRKKDAAPPEGYRWANRFDEEEDV